MLELLTQPSVWIGIAALIVLEIAIGADSYGAAARAGEVEASDRAARWRRLGFVLLWVVRMVLLFALLWLIDIEGTALTLFGLDFSWAGLVFALGGIFLVYKALEGITQPFAAAAPEKERYASGWLARFIPAFAAAAVLSVDSVVIAIGLLDNPWAMVLALTIGAVILFASIDRVMAGFARWPLLRALAAACLLPIGVVMLAGSAGVVVPMILMHATILAIAAYGAVLAMWQTRQSAPAGAAAATAAVVTPTEPVTVPEPVVADARVEPRIEPEIAIEPTETEPAAAIEPAPEIDAEPMPEIDVEPVAMPEPETVEPQPEPDPEERPELAADIAEATEPDEEIGEGADLPDPDMPPPVEVPLDAPEIEVPEAEVVQTQDEGDSAPLVDPEPSVQKPKRTRSVATRRPARKRAAPRKAKPRI